MDTHPVMGGYFSDAVCFTSITLMCLSIGTPKNNKFSICSKWKIYYFLGVPKFGQITA